MLKRRIAQRLRDCLREAQLVATPALGVANFPVDGETLELLSTAAERRVQEEHASVVRELGIEAETPLSAMGARLLDRALWLPGDFVGEAAELLIGDLACRPRDRGLLFLAPGPERKRFLAPLTALGEIETATEVFLATDGDTVPSGPAVTALSLPPNVSADTSWIVRFGEGPPYALVAGKPRSDGARPVFHSADPVLVEHMTFRLRAETGLRGARLMRLLVADHDRGRAKGIAEACTGRGHIVEVAQHGATALELSLERIPEAVICPIDLAVIDGVRLAEILRGNPRTRGTSFIFLVNDELDAPISMDSRDATVVAPWHEADVLDHVDAILERSARFGEIRSDTEIEGKLSQISIADLLQIFQMNQRSGSLKIAYEELPAPASIAIRGGQVVDALIPLADGTAVVGEKALYRVLCWKDGRFEFIPGEVKEQARIAKPPAHAAHGGHAPEGRVGQAAPRHAGPRFPAGAARAARADPEPRAPAHPRGARRGERLPQDRRDRRSLPVPGLPGAARARDLFSRDFLGLEHLRTTPEGGFQQSEAAIFSAPQVRRMREWAAGQRPKSGSVLKVVVASKERALVRAFVTALRESTHFVIDGRLARDTDKLGALGTLGHVPLGEHMTLRLISAPADAIYEPLWDVAANGMLGAIILPAGPFGAALEATEAISGAHARAQPALRAPAPARRTRAQPVRLGARDAPAPRRRLLLRAAAAVEPGAARGAAQRVCEARSVTHRSTASRCSPNSPPTSAARSRATSSPASSTAARPCTARARRRTRCTSCSGDGHVRDGGHNLAELVPGEVLGALSIVSIGKRECRSSARSRRASCRSPARATCVSATSCRALALRLQEAILRSFSALVRGVLEDSRAA